MKNKLSFICVYISLLLLLTIGIGELLFADRSGAVSESENRQLQAFPEFSVSAVADGSYMSDFESFMSDAFFYRDDAAAFSDSAKGLFSIESDEPDTGAIDTAMLFQTTEEEQQALEAILAKDDEQAFAEEQPSGALPVEGISVSSPGENDEAADPAPVAEAVAAELWIVDEDGNKKVLETYSANVMSQIAKELDAYREVLPEDGRVCFMHPPVSAIANNILRGKYVSWGSSVDDVLQSLVGQGVYIYDATDILEPYLDDESLNLYPITDHHWHPVSACLTANAMLRDMGLPVTDYSEYRYWLGNTNSGDPYTVEELSNMDVSDETVPVLEPLSPVRCFSVKKLDQMTEKTYIDRSVSSYRQYLGGTIRPWGYYETGFHTGRTALVIGDSFVNCFIPYLATYYDTILSVDFRDGGYSVPDAGANAATYIETYGVDDVYIVVCGYTPLSGEVMYDRLGRYLHLSY